MGTILSARLHFLFIIPPLHYRETVIFLPYGPWFTSEIHYFFSHDGRWFITTIIWIIFKLVIRTSWLITFKDISFHTNKIDGYIAYYHHLDNIQTCDKDLVAYYILKTFLFIRTREIHYFFSHDGRWFTSALRDPRGDPTTNDQSIGLMRVSIASEVGIFWFCNVFWLCWY